ncbi:MAG: hypothetical protein KA368_08265 [Acidobacteria bacterium]|nr:hypothetical protein [Acidobacteriota bacterium]
MATKDSKQAEQAQKWIEDLRHMLGAVSNVKKSNWGYRNHYCAGVGSEDEASFTEMEKAGLVTRGRVINDGNSVFFHATEAGMDAIGLKPAQKKRAMEK